MRNRDMLVFWGLCTFVFAGVVMFFKRDKARESISKKKLCPGIINLGNTCFLNSLLQALSPCSSIVQWFESVLKNSCSIKTSLSLDLYSAFKVLNNESLECSDQFNPRNILNTLNAAGWSIPKGEQDAYELFHVLLETLEEERLGDRPIISLFDGTSLMLDAVLPEDEGTSKFKNSLPKLPASISQLPLHGKIANQLICKRCNHHFPVKYDAFDSLSIPLSSHHSLVGVMSLESMLKQYVTSENIEGMKCGSCHTKTNFLKRMVLGKLPSTLCIHIQRTAWTPHGPFKRTDQVAFPDCLDMSQYTTPCHYSAIPLSILNQFTVTQRLPGGKDSGNAPNECPELMQTKEATNKYTELHNPYSTQINMLKALNYYYHVARSGFHSLMWAPNLKNKEEDTLSELQSLSRAYKKDAWCGSIGKKAYRLVSVIVHLGDVTSGHFVTYKRSPSRVGIRFPNKWIFTSDTVVRPASIHEVFSSNAYMLLYEKL